MYSITHHITMVCAAQTSATGLPSRNRRPPPTLCPMNIRTNSPSMQIREIEIITQETGKERHKIVQRKHRET